MTLEDRFWSKVHKTKSCWVWAAYKERRGYGYLRVGYKYKAAHRISVELDGRNIPKGMVIDHICRNKSCVRPDHLRVVTPRINALENSDSASAVNKRKTHCNNGHKYTKDSVLTYPTKKGDRVCKICRTKYMSEYYLKYKGKWKKKT